MITMLSEFKAMRTISSERATLPILGYVSVNNAILIAAYDVAYLTVKQGKPYSISEMHVKPAALKMANITLGNVAENKLSKSFSKMKPPAAE